MKGTTIVAVMALIIAIIALITGAYTAKIEGPMGPIGPKGDIGLQGPQGIPGINGTDGEDGSIGPIGPRGPSGSDGRDGKDGEDGLDYIPNLATSIVNVSLNGTYIYRPCVWHDFTFLINVTVNDAENDSLHVDFYYRTNETYDWVKHRELIGISGIYNDSVLFSYFKDSNPKTLYWLVEIWDGSDLSLNYYNYTIVPVIL